MYQKYGADKTTKTPSKGAMGSSIGAAAGFDTVRTRVDCITYFGAVISWWRNKNELYVVMLVSGYANGTTNAWQLSLYHKETQKIVDADYFSPADVDYKPKITKIE